MPALTPGESTVDDAAAAYYVTTHKVLRVLRDTLTDVYTPEGDAGVIEHAGRRWAWVTGAHGTSYHKGTAIVLGRDALAVLDVYLARPSRV